MMNNFVEHKTEIPVEEPAEVKDVTEEITNYFGGERPSHTVAVE
jgi:hypothetical protein